MPKPKPLPPFFVPARFCLQFEEEDEHYWLFRHFPHLQFQNDIYVLSFPSFDTWHYLGHPFPSFLYSCHISNISTCYKLLSSHHMSFYGTRNAMPRKTCQLRLSRNSTKFDVVARFCETIPTVKSILSSEI